MGNEQLYDLLGFNEFHVAIAESAAARVEKLMAGGLDIDAVSLDGDTPLMLAARHGYVDGVLALLRHHANPNIRDRRGRAPWQEAARARNRRIMTLLESAGATQEHIVSNGQCVLCNISEASLPSSPRCSPGSLDALRTRLATIPSTYPLDGATTVDRNHPFDDQALRRVGPFGLFPTRHLLVVIQAAIQADGEAWEIRSDVSTERDHMYFGVFLHHGCRDTTMDVATFPLPRQETERLLARIRGATITVLPVEYPQGPDGTAYELELAHGALQTNLKWWEEGPGQWHEVVSGVRDIVEFLKRSRLLHKGAMKANGLPLPALLVDLIREERWVQPDSETIRNALPSLRGDIEFLPVDRFTVATCNMKQLAEHPFCAEKLCLYRSSVAEEDRDLPWLDLDRAVLLCDAAEYGSDIGVALDYRGDTDDPRVVASAWKAGQNQWTELTPRFSDFVEALGLRKKYTPRTRMTTRGV